MGLAPCDETLIPGQATLSSCSFLGGMISNADCCQLDIQKNSYGDRGRRGSLPLELVTILAEPPTAKLDGPPQKAFIAHAFVGQLGFG